MCLLRGTLFAYSLSLKRIYFYPCSVSDQRQLIPLLFIFLGSVFTLGIYPGRLCFALVALSVRVLLFPHGFKSPGMIYPNLCLGLLKLCPNTLLCRGMFCPCSGFGISPKTAKRVPLCYACYTKKDLFKGYSFSACPCSVILYPCTPFTAYVNAPIFVLNAFKVYL